MSVDFPILPFIDREEDGSVRFFKRNPRLAAPSDFDYSPYFAIIKYPYLGLNDIGLYHRLPWTDDDVYNDERHAFKPTPAKPPTAPAVVAETPEPEDERGLEALALEVTEPDEIDDAAMPVGSRRHHAFAFLRRRG